MIDEKKEIIKEIISNLKQLETEDLLLINEITDKIKELKKIKMFIK